MKKVNKATSANYDTVDTAAIVRYIQEYTERISTGTADAAELAEHSRTNLKCIAAELETVCKRLDAMRGKY